MKLPAWKLQDIIRFGYCEKAVEYAASTTAADSAARITWMTGHIPSCPNCARASRLKALEADAAEALGPDAVSIFTHGGDITLLPGYEAATDQAIDKGLKNGTLLPEDIRWALEHHDQTTTRHGSIDIIPVVATLSTGRKLNLEPVLRISMPIYSKDLPKVVAEDVAMVPRHIALKVHDDVIEGHDTDAGGMYFSGPANPKALQEFQKLWTIWDWWFLRLCYTDGVGGKPLYYTDFQVCGKLGKVYPIQDQLEGGSARMLEMDPSQWGFEKDVAKLSGLPDVEPLSKRRALEFLVGAKLPVKVREQPPLPEGERMVVSRTLFLDDREPTRQSIAHSLLMEFNTGMALREAPKKRPHQWIIDNYLRAMQLIVAEAPLLRGGAQRGDDDEFAAVFANLREANIYELRPDDYFQFFQLSVNYLTSTCDVQIGDDDLKEKLAYLGGFVQYPEHLPFPCVYVGWGSGFPLKFWQESAAHTMGHLPREVLKTARAQRPRIVGTLICEDGRCYEVGLEDADCSVSAYLVHDQRGWSYQHSMTGPWFITLLVQALQDFRTVIKGESPSMTTRQMYKDASRVAKRQFLPRPYYTVRLADLVIEEKVRALPTIKIPVEWSHRWSVRAHDRLYVRRGQLPLSEKKRKSFAREGFEVFVDPKDVSSEAYSIIIRKGIQPLQLGEWMAVKRTPIEHRIQPLNRQDLPYIPSTRKPNRRVLPPGAETPDDELGGDHVRAHQHDEPR